MNISTGLGDNFTIFSLAQVSFLSRAGIYHIWTQEYNSASFNMIYVGQTGDFNQRLDPTHHKYESWVANARNGLYVSVWTMPSTIYSPDDRRTVEQTLIRQYNPICNG